LLLVRLWYLGADGAMQASCGQLLVTGLWDSLLSQLRVWAGSVDLPL